MHYAPRSHRVLVGLCGIPPGPGQHDAVAARRSGGRRTCSAAVADTQPTAVVQVVEFAPEAVPTRTPTEMARPRQRRCRPRQRLLRPQITEKPAVPRVVPVNPAPRAPASGAPQADTQRPRSNVTVDAAVSRPESHPPVAVTDGRRRRRQLARDQRHASSRDPTAGTQVPVTPGDATPRPAQQTPGTPSNAASNCPERRHPPNHAHTAPARARQRQDHDGHTRPGATAAHPTPTPR